MENPSDRLDVQGMNTNAKKTTADVKLRTWITAIAALVGIMAGAALLFG